MNGTSSNIDAGQLGDTSLAATPPFLPPQQGGPSPQGSAAPTNELTQKILQALAQAASRKQMQNTAVPSAIPGFSDPEAARNIGMGTANPHAWGAQRFAASLATGIRNAVAKEKQGQLLKAEGDWNYLQSSMNELYTAQQSGDPNAIQQAQEKVNLILADPKKLKNMAKALNQDWLNPEKTTVYGEALKNVMKQTDQKAGAQQGLKGMIMKLLGQKQALQRQATMNSLSDEQKRQMAREIERRAPATSGAAFDPKMAEQLLNQDRLEREFQQRQAQQKQEHDETLEERKRQDAANNQIKLGQLETQRMILAQRAEDQKLNREQREKDHKDNIALREQEMALRKQIAEGSGDANDWADVIRRGGKLSDIPAKERTGVVSYMEKNNIAIPKPLSTAEQKNMDDVLETINKVDGWQQDLQKFVDPKTGKLSNKPFTMLSGTLAYKFGVNTPESAMISDFSRERWQAIAPLLHGIRRGDIIQDIVKHTPDPLKDSPELMATKLQQLKKNYGEARTAILQSHGFDIDPTTGEQIGKMGEIHYKIVNGTLVPDTQSAAPK